MKILTKAATAAVLTASLVVAGLPAKAEGLIRIVEQFGTLYLPLHVIRDQGLIEKYGKAEGLDIKVEWAKLSGGAAINEALLSGNVDIAAAGIGPFLTLWDKTGGSVKIIGALGAQPNYLVTNKPEIKTLKDFTAADKIALPAVGVSVQARLLQIAAEKEFGVGNHKQLDGLTVTLPHPDATAALLSGSTEITAHISNSPFQEQALASGKVHRVLSSYDILGGPATPTLVYTTIKFREENPKTYKAFYDAFQEATAWIAANKPAAAETYVRIEKSKLDPAFVLKVLENPEVQYTTTPLRTQVFADFLYRTGAIKTQAKSWTDYTFEELHSQPGS